MKNYRITKYNPSFRDENGYYTRDEWISMSQVGKEFNGKEFHLREYLAVEANYVATIELIMNFFNCNELQVNNIENGIMLLEKYKNLYNHEIINLYKNAHNGMILTINENLSNFVLLILRGDLWANLVSVKGRFKFVFGYDFYMYLSTQKLLSENIIAEIEKLNIFVEPMQGGL